MYTIYKITNLLNGKLYIGQTKDFVKRKWKHIHENNKTIIHKAIAEFGVENFKFEKIDKVETKEEAYNKEIGYIKKYNSVYPNGYNLSEGGTAYPKQDWFVENTRKRHIGKKLSDETKRKMSEAHKGFKFTDESKIKMSNKRKGIKLSIDTRKKMSESKKGANNPVSRKVICVETNEIFDSMKSAEEIKHIKNICLCCNKKRNTAGGYHWRYLDEAS